MERKGIYSLQEVLDHVVFDRSDKKRAPRRVWCCDGDEIDMASLRYQTFKENGTSCAICGIDGKFFAKERHISTSKQDGPYHFNLYALDKDGKEVIMTKDHIIARCNSGNDSLKNLRTLCSPCNLNKSIEDKRIKTERESKSSLSEKTK